MKQATIFASTIGTIATTTLFVQPPLQAKALDTLPPNLSNSFPKPDTRNILTNPSGITPPEQLPNLPSRNQQSLTLLTQLANRNRYNHPIASMDNRSPNPQCWPCPDTSIL
jgi:hypothetical protein